MREQDERRIARPASEGVAEIAKGVFAAAPIAMGTSKLSTGFDLALIAVSIGVFNLGYQVAGGKSDDAS